MTANCYPVEVRFQLINLREFNIYNHLKMNIMKKYICIVCDYIYDPALGDPENGVEPGTAFEDLPDDWVCPLCGVGKDQFEPVKEN